MFIGHFAVGFACKRLAPNVSLGVLMSAPLLLDVLWPLLVVAGAESLRLDPGNTAVTPLDLHDFPYSHSLLMALFWSLVVLALSYLWRREIRSACVLALAVSSHWLLDFLAHGPDLPLYPGSDLLLGMGLWNSVPATLVFEGTLFVVGVLAYARGTVATTWRGSVGLWTLVGTLAVVYVAAIFGPPPPHAGAVIIGALASVLFLPWSGWVDAQRALDPRAYDVQSSEPWRFARSRSTQGSPSVFSRT